jgi:hypothetical protein
MIFSNAIFMVGRWLIKKNRGEEVIQASWRKPAKQRSGCF